MDTWTPANPDTIADWLSHGLITEGEAIDLLSIYNGWRKFHGR